MNTFLDKDGKAILKELEIALNDFVNRLSLVRQAILDLGLTPEELKRAGPASWIQKDIPQSGVWIKNSEWRYFLHGKGCRLTNLLNGETLDWNSKNESGYDIDPYAFIHYLTWRVENVNDLQKLAEYKEKESINNLVPQILRIIKLLSSK